MEAMDEKKQELIKEYVITGGELFRITEIDIVRDGGTRVIFTSNKNKSFYIPKDGYAIHSGIPYNDDNRIIDPLLENYLTDRLEAFIIQRRVMLEQSVDLLWDLENKPNQQ